MEAIGRVVLVIERLGVPDVRFFSELAINPFFEPFPGALEVLKTALVAKSPLQYNRIPITLG